MPDQNKTAVYLSDRESNIFIKIFIKHLDIWEQAEQLKPGSLVLHFDPAWDIKKYELHFYKKTKTA